MDIAADVQERVTAWKKADEVASRAEKALVDALQGSGSGPGPRALGELLADVRRLRRVADQHLDATCELLECARRHSPDSPV
jgi:hypothetical protein